MATRGYRKQTTQSIHVRSDPSGEESFPSYPYLDIQLASQAPKRVRRPKAPTYDSRKRCADADAVGAQV
jgi:hypothetical protein